MQTDRSAVSSKMRKRGHPEQGGRYDEPAQAKRQHGLSGDSYSHHKIGGRSSLSADRASERSLSRLSAIENWQRLRPSRWDEKPKGWESVTVTALKLCNMLNANTDFSRPPPSNVVDLCSVRALTANNSSAISTVIVQNGDPSEYLVSLFEETLGEKNVKVEVRTVADQHVVTLPSPKHTAYFWALHGDYQLKRFPGLVTTSSGSVFSSTKTSIIHGLEPNETVGTAREKFPTMTRNPLFIKNLVKSTMCEAAFALFEGDLPENAEPLFPETNDQQPEISQSTKADDFGTIVNRAIDEGESIAKATNVLLILNAVKSFNEPHNALQSILSKCTEFGHVEYTKLSKDSNYLPRVIVKFGTSTECTTALEALGGRTFCGRILVTTYGNEAAADQDLY